MSNVRQRKTVNSEAKENKAKEQKNGSPKINKKETENKGFYRHILKRFLKQICGLLFFLYVIIPVFVKTNPWIHSKMVFLNMVRWPPFIDLTKPWEFGLRGARNFYLDVNEESRIGVWQILANSSVEKGGDFDKPLGNGKKVILYLHGTTGTRGGWHRVQLLKLLASLDFHVVAFDYRGYGDSKGHPTEDGVVEDGYFMYKWIKERSKDSSVILWGHSLGTAITTKLARLLCIKNEDPDGVVLESPFNNIRDAAIRHPFTALFRFMPMFKEIFIDTIAENGIYFSSDENIAQVTSPLMMIHAEDDEIVPYELGRKLYEAAEKTRKIGSASIEFISFNASEGLGHKHIFKALEIPNIVKNFIHETCRKD
ncbi:lysophosphatidylserine lipase ABHD12-like [Mytilus trossulus]|uniref:lysophosphatidylserine lipase ABHD12-like n=1 Tax=Mytilus trossulus TaxID=6551 RepID=UPI003003F48D